MQNRQVVEKGKEENEQKRRDVILTQVRRAVLIQIRNNDPIHGLCLKKKVHDEESVNEKRVIEAQNRGLDPMAYMRGKPDTGTQVLNSMAGVRASNLVKLLEAKGLHYVEGWWFIDDKDKYVYCLLFSVDGEKQPLPKEVIKVLGRRFGTCNIWANPRTDQHGKRIRTDSINLGNPFAKQESQAEELILSGNTYRLV